jgi:hypothetical protein
MQPIIHERGNHMQAIKGLFTDGWFTPASNVALPRRASAILILEETPTSTVNETRFLELEFDDEQQARQEWLARLRVARQLAEGETLPYFPPRTPMEQPHGLSD